MLDENPFNFDIKDLYSEIELNNLLTKIAGKIQVILDCQESSIFLYHTTKEELYFEIATGQKSHELKRIVLKKGEGVVGWIAANRRSLIINDCPNDSRFSSKADEEVGFTTRSILGVPVIMNGQLLGVIEAINKNDSVFDNLDREKIEYIAQAVAVPLQNALLFHKITEETVEKDRLIELAKSISLALKVNEVFVTLKKILKELFSVKEILVRVDKENILYRLVAGNTSPAGGIHDDEFTGFARLDFPLTGKTLDLGTFSLITEKRIADEFHDFIRGIALFVALSLERFAMIDTIIEKEKLDKELSIAREIQQSFLLHQKPDIKGVEVDFINIPSSHVGGDYYDAVPVNDSQTVFTLNDVSGHGIPASLIMSIVRSNFVFSLKKKEGLKNTILHINNLLADTTEPNLFVTSFSCRVDTEKKTWQYINAGHVAPVYVHQNKVEEMRETGMVLGLFPDIDVVMIEKKYEAGDLLFLYTDGLVEAENRTGEQFSLARLENLILSMKDRPLAEIKNRVIHELNQFVGANDFVDDVTFLMVRFK